MSTTRLFSLLGSSLLVRTHHSRVTICPLQFPKAILPHPFLCFRRHCSASAAVLDTELHADINRPQQHPWPEWVTFVDCLKTKGYIAESAGQELGSSLPSEPAVQENVRPNDVLYTEMSLLKDACLSFARDRFDVFGSLSRQHIQTIVEKGCPNLFRKAVNSAKRLRVYLQLDEGDVCSVCNLRGSCDRAYVILNESESAARTVDIMRILLLYALDPLLISSGEKLPGRDLIEVSARKLISELTELSVTPPDPELSKPSVQVPKEKKPSLKFADNDRFQNAEIKRGDWICQQCNFMNFSRNIQCKTCGADGPKSVHGAVVDTRRADGVKSVHGAVADTRKGDWLCSECSFTNFARNVRCLKCKAEGPKRIPQNNLEMKKGDWNCPECGFMNFARKSECLRCTARRPKRNLNPGEWECSSCDFLNFKGNIFCKKCNSERPKEVIESQYEQQTWKKPL